MTRITLSLALLALLAACGDGQPFFNDGVATEGDGAGEGNGDGGDGDGLDGDVALPPGTNNPTASAGIVRFEARNNIGGGFAQEFTYNAANDTFTVDNIAFDGENVYQRGREINSLGDYAVYDADIVTPDSLTGLPVGQIVPYRGILGLSDNVLGDERATTFGIVRTGGYRNYGFGGYVYERNGEAVLPTSGQAAFNGSYAGLRTYTNRAGLDYTSGDIQVAIDFEDFNANDAVQGTITNRLAFDEDGVQVGNLRLPVMNFTITEGASTLDGTGELSGRVTSSIDIGNGELELYEDGVYFAVIAGDTTTLTCPRARCGGEVVGIIVVESEDRRYEDVTAQETGGFIAYRTP